ncbi:large-conductance mechanosensitive channel protein MscL [Rhodococcus aerolatus]
MVKGFKDFILRGNVIDLAVAVVIGAAFGAIVTAFTGSIIKPLIAAIGGAESPGLGFTLRAGNENTFVDFGAVITAAINFLIVAAVVYFILVLPMNKLKERRKAGVEDGPAEPTDVELLIEIRDLLARSDAAGTGAGTTAGIRPGTITTDDAPGDTGRHGTGR